MGKRLSNIQNWQWGGNDSIRQCPTNLALHLIAVPLFILAILLVLDGLFSLSFSSLAIGVIGLVAASGITRNSH